MAKDFTEAQKYLTGYLQALRKKGAVIPPEAERSYTDYLRALHELEALTTRYTTPEVNGDYPAVTAQDRTALIDRYRAVLKAGSICLGRIGGKTPVLTECARLITFLNGRLLRDLSGLSSVKPEERLSLPEIAERSKRLNLELPDDTEIVNVSGSSSSRMPVSYRDAAGTTRSGFFTPKKTVCQPIPELMQWAAELKAISPRFGTAMERFIQNPPFPSPIASLNMASVTWLDPMDSLNLIKNFQDNRLPFSEQELLQMSRNQPLVDKLVSFLHRVIEIERGINQYTAALGLSPEIPRRVDSRNTAMSSMANLLGIPHLLAVSRPATLIRNGAPVDGTFTEKAEGTDLRLLKDGDPVAGYRAGNDPERAWLKDYFDLQILDFLCQNIDRHLSNFIYQFDCSDPERPKLIGLKGIDNDFCFGNLDVNSNLDKLSSLNNIRCISASMKATIEALDPEMVRTALAGCGLQPDETDAACERLRVLQEQVPHMNVVEDSEWKDIPRDRLKPDAGGLSVRIFRDIYEMDLPQYLAKQEEDPDPEPEYMPARSIEPLNQNGFLRTLERVEALDRLSYENQHWYLIFAKPQYRQMRDAVVRLKETMIRAGGEPTADKLIELAENLEEVQLWADGYLTVKGEPHGTRAEGRVHAASELLRFTKEVLPAVYSRISSNQVQIGTRLSELGESGRARIMEHVTGQRTENSSLKEAFADLCLDALLKQARSNAREAGTTGPGALELALMKYGTKAVWKKLEQVPGIEAVESRLFPSGKADNARLAEFMSPDDRGRSGAARLAETVLSGGGVAESLRQLQPNVVTRAIDNAGRVL